MLSTSVCDRGLIVFCFLKTDTAITRCLRPESTNAATMQMWSFYAVAISLLYGSLAKATPVKVTTPWGPVVGTSHPVLDTHVNAFLGIPYAESPVGARRFARPELIEKWTAPVDATSLSPACWQVEDTAFDGFPGVQMWNPNTRMDEDCLYLNVWAPANATDPLPIVVWIYGGSFSSGSANLALYDGRLLAAQAQTIVVSMQYRLGPLGFLYAGQDTSAPGNAGMLDQYVAVRWVHANAAAFGGDPARITLWGESAGAAAASLHLLSELTSPLVAGCVMLSGAALAPFAVHSPAVATRRFRDFSARLDCDGHDDRARLACLMLASPERLTEQQWHVADDSFFHTAFVPVVDGYFLQAAPKQLMDEGRFKKVDIMLGSVANEGTYFLVYNLPQLFPLDSERPLTEAQFRNGTAKIVKKKFGELAADLVGFEYGVPYEFSHEVDYRRQLDAIYSDSSFVCPVLQFAEYYAHAQQKAYVYQYVHRSSANPWPAWMGVMHGYEIDVMFGQPLNASLGYTAAEAELSRDVVAYLANYLHSGDPNHGVSPVRHAWPPHSATNREYLVLHTGPPAVRHGLRARPCAFWRQFLPGLVKDEDFAGCFTSMASTHHAMALTLVFSVISHLLW